MPFVYCCLTHSSCIVEVAGLASLAAAMAASTCQKDGKKTFIRPYLFAGSVFSINILGCVCMMCLLYQLASLAVPVLYTCILCDSLWPEVMLVQSF